MGEDTALGTSVADLSAVHLIAAVRTADAAKKEIQKWVSTFKATHSGRAPELEDKATVQVLYDSYKEADTALKSFVAQMDATEKRKDQDLYEMRSAKTDRSQLLTVVRKLSLARQLNEARCDQLQTRALKGEADAHHALAAREEAMKQKEVAEAAAKELRLQIRHLENEGAGEPYVDSDEVDRLIQEGTLQYERRAAKAEEALVKQTQLLETASNEMADLKAERKSLKQEVHILSSEGALASELVEARAAAQKAEEKADEARQRLDAGRVGFERERRQIQSGYNALVREGLAAKEVGRQQSGAHQHTNQQPTLETLNSPPPHNWRFSCSARKQRSPRRSALRGIKTSRI